MCFICDVMRFVLLSTTTFIVVIASSERVGVAYAFSMFMSFCNHARGKARDHCVQTCCPGAVHDNQMPFIPYHFFIHALVDQPSPYFSASSSLPH